MDCTEFRGTVDLYLTDALDGSRSSAFRGHLASCAECRLWAAGVDPTLMFSARPLRAPDRARVEQCTAEVLGQIRQQRLARRLAPMRRGWLAAAAAVIMAIAAAAVWQLAPVEEQQAPAGVAEAGDSGRPQPPPRLQVNMPDEGVRVYQFATSDSQDSAVYFVVNPALDS